MHDCIQCTTESYFCILINGKNRSGQSCSISCEDVIGNGDHLLGEVGIADDSLEDEKQQDGSDSQSENSDEVVIQWNPMEVKTCWERMAELTGKQTVIHETKRLMLMVDSGDDIETHT